MALTQHYHAKDIAYRIASIGIDTVSLSVSEIEQKRPTPLYKSFLLSIRFKETVSWQSNFLFVYTLFYQGKIEHLHFFIAALRSLVSSKEWKRFYNPVITFSKFCKEVSM